MLRPLFQPWEKEADYKTRQRTSVLGGGKGSIISFKTHLISSGVSSRHIAKVLKVKFQGGGRKGKEDGEEKQKTTNPLD